MFSHVSRIRFNGSFPRSGDRGGQVCPASRGHYEHAARLQHRVRREGDEIERGLAVEDSYRKSVSQTTEPNNLR